MKTAFICPFNLEQATGTPFRTRTTTESVASFSDVHVIAPEGKIVNQALTVHILGPGGLLHFTTQTIKKLREIKPNVVHGITTASVLPMVIYKIFFNHKSKIIFEMHGFAWFETADKLSFIKRVAFLKADIIGLFFADLIIAMSFTQKNFLLKFNRRKHIEVIWGPVDFDIIFENPERHAYLTVGYLGNSSWWQGLPCLIAAAGVLEETHEKIIFELAGFDYSDAKKFPGYKNVRYKGKVLKNEVSNFIKSCDVMISPRIKDRTSDLQYPHKLSGYLASGRPVIGSAVSDQPQIIKESGCGFLVDPLTSENIAQSLLDFKKLSYEERVNLGKRASLFAQEHFALPIFTKKLKMVYQSLLGF